MISEKLFIGFHPSVDQKQREKNLKNADLHYRAIRDSRAIRDFQAVGTKHTWFCYFLE